MFQVDRLYRTDDPELEKIGKPQTLARWRCEGWGPKFMRVGQRVCYLGQDLNGWLESRKVETRVAKDS